MANAEFREEVDDEIHGRDFFQSKEGLVDSLELSSFAGDLREHRSLWTFGAEFRRAFSPISSFSRSDNEPQSICDEDLEGYSFQNSGPCAIPKVEALADGLSVPGSGEDPVLEALRPAPVRPPRRLGRLPLFSPRRPGTSQSGALRLPGRQLGTRQPSGPGAR